MADVDQVAVYHNCDADALPESVVDRIRDGTIDWITRTSPAITHRGCTGFCRRSRRGRIGKQIRIASRAR